jgi:hypothetical protein
MLNKETRTIMALVAASALILAVGGVSIASNMGFKLNKQLFFRGSGQVGVNWTSIPQNHPYSGAPCTIGGPCAGALCAALNLTSTGLSRGTIIVLNATTGQFQTGTCGGTANTLALPSGQGVAITQPGAAGGSMGAIIVGSHNPTLTLTIPKAGNGNIGNLWFALPYHTTAVTGQDVCAQIGMTGTGISRGTVTRLNAQTGAFTQGTCGSTAGSLNLVLGEQMQLREPNGPKSFSPAHF